MTDTPPPPPDHPPAEGAAQEDVSPLARGCFGILLGELLFWLLVLGISAWAMLL
jgi:hypothetical protein